MGLGVVQGVSMDLATIDGFATAIIGENDDELKAFIESRIGLEVREFSDDAVAYAAKTMRTPVSLAEVQARTDKDSERINALIECAGNAFIEQYPTLGTHARELLKRRVRLVALQHIESAVLMAQWRIQNQAKGGVVVQ